MKYKEAKQEVCDLLLGKSRIDNLHVKEAIAEKLSKDKKFSRLQFLKIWNEKILYEDLDIVALCALYQAYSESTNLPDISKFFTDTEISESKNFIVLDEDLKYPLVFENVVRLNENHFNIPMPTSLINQLQTSKLLTRDRESQRETIIRDVDGRQVEHLKIFPKSIKEIKLLLLSGDYHPDELKFNLNDNGDAQWEYDEEAKQLTVYAGDISLIDGNNRVIAIEEAMDEDPNINISFPVSFTIFPLWKAQAIIYQQEKKNPINASVTATYEIASQNDIVNDIVRSEELSIYLRGKILKTRDNVRTSGVFLFADLSEAIKLAYDNNDLTRNKKKTVAWLIEFLNEVSYILEDKFKSPKLSRKDTWALDPVAVYVYILLSKELQGKNEWQNILEKILFNIDFSKNNSPMGRLAKKENMAAKKFMEGMISDG